MTWLEWVNKFTTFMGWFDDDVMGMVTEWADVFERKHFTPEEMQAATEDVASMSSPPKARIGYFEALQGAARARRADEVTRRSPSPAGVPSGASCALCGDGGWASVPHPRREYRDKGASFAVFCHCPAGQYLQSHFEPTEMMKRQGWRPMSLQEYETQWVPRWREILATQKAERRARRYTMGLDESLGDVVRKLGRMPPSPRPQRPVPPGNQPPAG